MRCTTLHFKTPRSCLNSFLNFSYRDQDPSPTPKSQKDQYPETGRGPEDETGPGPEAEIGPGPEGETGTGPEVETDPGPEAETDRVPEDEMGTGPEDETGPEIETATTEDAMLGNRLTDSQTYTYTAFDWLEITK